MTWAERLVAAARDPEDRLGRDLEADGALVEFMDTLVAVLGDAVDQHRAEVPRGGRSPRRPGDMRR